MTWAAVAALAAGSWALKAVGPVLAGGRRMPRRLALLTALLPPALLSALVAIQTVTQGQTVVLDARLPAVAVAGIAMWRGAPFVVIILAGTITAAALRAVGIG